MAIVRLIALDSLAACFSWTEKLVGDPLVPLYMYIAPPPPSLSEPQFRVSEFSVGLNNPACRVIFCNDSAVGADSVRKQSIRSHSIYRIACYRSVLLSRVITRCE